MGTELKVKLCLLISLLFLIVSCLSISHFLQTPNNNFFLFFSKIVSNQCMLINNIDLSIKKKTHAS